MKISLVLAICLFTFLTGTSQIDNRVKNNIQNKEWLNALKKLDLDSQLAAIRERISFDTTINLSAPYRSYIFCRTGMSNEEIERTINLPRRKSDSANLTAFPLWIINQGSEYITANFSKDISSKNFMTALSLIDRTHISAVTFLPDQVVLALYGAAGIGGVVFLHVGSKKILRKFKRLTKVT